MPFEDELICVVNLQNRVFLDHAEQHEDAQQCEHRHDLIGDEQ